MKTPESMQQLEELFHEAAGLAPPERAELLARARKANAELAAAVESLIAAHEEPDSPIDSPAFDVAAEIIADSQPALVAGQVVGHYQIIGPLGKGGMGEVYLANDGKLGRKVALKLLPADFTNHRERLRRFIREAKTASLLNHPNIITIHEIGEVEGVHFIATEYIDGQTLKQHIAYSRMTLPELLEVAIQAANALLAAHAAGIIHRDIKPENIMLRPDGYVKVLDFGLAKLTEDPQPASPADSEIDTMVKTQTVPGTVLGTIKYMSPEQARGQALDQRTDIFSLGIVLYEMAAGRVPFAGATRIDTLVSILEKDPVSLDHYVPEVPPEFQRIISKALRKDREERYQTIKDLLIDLKSLKEDLTFQKLERSRPSGSTGEALTNESATIIQPLTRPSAAPAALPASVPRNAKSVRRAAPLALALVVLAGILIAGGMWWRRGEPGPAPAQSSLLPLAQRTINYWIMVQKYRDNRPYQVPFRLSDNINFEKDYRLRLHVTSSQAGYLYLLNEGPPEAGQAPTFNVFFPSTATKGSALLTQGQQVQIPGDSELKFDGQQGTEKIWLVWAAQAVPELEAVKGFANKQDRGAIVSPGLRAAVDQFLKAHSSTDPAVQRDQEKKETVVSANNAILVHVIKLEHH